MSLVNEHTRDLTVFLAHLHFCRLAWCFWVVSAPVNPLRAGVILAALTHVPHSSSVSISDGLVQFHCLGS